MSPRDVENGVVDDDDAAADALPPAFAIDIDDNGAEQRFGILMVLLLVMALPLNYFFSLLAMICVIIVIFIAGNVLGGCCCSSQQYYFEPHVVKWTKAILSGAVSYVVLWLSLTFYYDMTFLPHKPGSSTTSSWNDDDFSMSQTVVTVLSYVCLLVALVFSVLFTWGKEWKHIVT